MLVWSLVLSVSLSVFSMQTYTNSCAELHVHTNIHTQTLAHKAAPPPRALLLVFAEVLSCIIKFQCYNSCVQVERVFGCHSGEAWFPVTAHISLSFCSSNQMMGYL